MGEPVVHALRRVLSEARSSEEAARLLAARAPMVSHIVIVTDQQGRTASIERAPGHRDAVRWLSVHHGSVLASESSWTNQVIDELDGIVGVVAAAVLCGDAGIVAEHRAWIAGLVAGGVAPTAVADVGFDAVAAVVGAVSPQAAALLAGG